MSERSQAPTNPNTNQKPNGADQKNIVTITPSNAAEELKQALTNYNLPAMSLILKNIPLTKPVAAEFCNLLRGQGRTWEGVTIDFLLHKDGRMHFEEVLLEECTSEYVDTCISVIMCVDNVRKLALTSTHVSQYAAQSMSSGLQFNHYLQSLQLDLLDVRLVLPYLIAGLEANTSLKQLFTSRCGLTDDNLALIVKALEPHPELKELRIYGNKCRQKGLAAISKLLNRFNTKLEILDVSYQHVDEKDGGFDIFGLCQALARNSSLRVLDMDNDAIDDGHMAHLASALTQNKTLQELMLNHNKITGEGVALFASKFGQMKGLKKISMFSNQFGA